MDIGRCFSPRVSFFSKFWLFCFSILYAPGLHPGPLKFKTALRPWCYFWFLWPLLVSSPFMYIDVLIFLCINICFSFADLEGPSKLWQCLALKRMGNIDPSHLWPQPGSSSILGQSWLHGGADLVPKGNKKGSSGLHQGQPNKLTTQQSGLAGCTKHC